MEYIKRIFTKNNYKILGYIVAIVIMLFLVKNILFRWNEVSSFVFNVNIWLFVCSLVVYIIFYFLLALGWVILIRKHSTSASIIVLLKIYFKSQFAKYLPGGLWNNVGRYYLCISEGISSRAIINSLVVENLFIIISSTIILVFMLGFFNISLLRIPLIVLLLIILSLIVIMHPSIFNKVIGLIGKLLKKDIVSEGYTFSFLLTMLLYYLLCWGIFGISFSILVCSFEPLTIKQLLFSMVSFPASWIFGFISPSPGGVGVREGVLVILLKNYFNEQTSIFISVISRIWITLGEVATFCLFLIYQSKFFFGKRNIRIS